MSRMQFLSLNALNFLPCRTPKSKRKKIRKQKIKIINDLTILMRIMTIPLAAHKEIAPFPGGFIYTVGSDGRIILNTNIAVKAVYNDPRKATRRKTDSGTVLPKKKNIKRVAAVLQNETM